jgi:glycosyltransferase involved in cell wall biosynthesis
MDSENKKNPAISVIIPTYNRAKLIGEALASVVAQTFTDFEILVVDDASTDDTSRVVEEYMKKVALRYVRLKKNTGVSAARNAGVAMATGKYIAMLDSDDVWLDKEKLSRQIDFLETNPDHALVGTWIRTIDAGGDALKEIRFETSDADIRRYILARNQFAQSSVLFRKEAAIGGYDSSLTVNEDYDLWLNIGTKWKFANIPQFSTGYRVHGGNIIREKRTLATRLHLAIIRKYKSKYPGYPAAATKALARIILSYF